MAGDYSESANLLASFGMGEDDFTLTVTYTKTSDDTTQTLTMTESYLSNDVSRDEKVEHIRGHLLSSAPLSLVPSSTYTRLSILSEGKLSLQQST